MTDAQPVDMRRSSPPWDVLFLMLALILGAIVRFAPTVMAGGPVNDGGMFYSMIDDLIANGFRLPPHASYNATGIPFAYPPLSLYVGAALASVGIPTGEVVRWLPPLISTLSILAFYWTCSIMLGSGSTAALSSVAYALMPRTFSWYVMGGGLSRSFGVLFLLLTCGSAWLLFTKPASKRVLLTALLGAGAVLSHPETGLHTLAACALIWLLRGRTRAHTRSSFLVAGSVVILTAPWWATVLAQHGFAAFQSAMGTGAHNGLFWVPWLTMDFAEERFVTVFTVLGLIGIVVQSLRGAWFLPVWMLAAFAVEPRSATAIAALPLAMLAGVGLGEFVLPQIGRMNNGEVPATADWLGAMSTGPAARIAAAYLVFLAFLGAFAYNLALSRYVVSPSAREAMTWIRQNTIPGSQFVMLTGSPDPFSDPQAEWFPVFTGRTSVTTIQGQEWTLGGAFLPFLNDLKGLGACVNQSPACIEDWAAAHDLTYEYIYVNKPQASAAQPAGLLLYQLRQNARYELVYENVSVVIFARR